MFDYDILKVNDFNIQKEGVKKYYSTDGLRTIKEWYKDEDSPSIDFPGCSSVFNLTK
jgi:hypothetical protein